MSVKNRLCWLKIIPLSPSFIGLFIVLLMTLIHHFLPLYPYFHTIEFLLFLSLVGLMIWITVQLIIALQKWIATLYEFIPALSLPQSHHPILMYLLQTQQSNTTPLTEATVQNRKYYLKILYDIACTINLSYDLKELLPHFLKIITASTHADAGTIRLLTPQGKMELVASLGLEEEFTKKERITPIQRCLYGTTLIQNDIIFASDIPECKKLSFPFENEKIELVIVPLEYQGRKLGTYTLFIQHKMINDRDELKVLLSSVAKQLSIAIEKTYLDKESQRITILEERTQMAHELHDSLAQTLASLRFQVASLQNIETIHHPEITRLQASIDEAYQEVRELISHFRTPLDKRGLMIALDNIIEDFKQKTDIAVFVQNEWTLGQLPHNLDLQVLRILQEALTNIQKHSQARNVRILLRSDPDGENKILIEDDGMGFQLQQKYDNSGEHIGLTVMEERAQRLGGILRIESEPGEGTRLILTFPAIAEY